MSVFGLYSTARTQYLTLFLHFWLVCDSVPMQSWQLIWIRPEQKTKKLVNFNKFFKFLMGFESNHFWNSSIFLMAYLVKPKRWTEKFVSLWKAKKFQFFNSDDYFHRFIFFNAVQNLKFPFFFWNSPFFSEILTRLQMYVGSRLKS